MSALYINEPDNPNKLDFYITGYRIRNMADVSDEAIRNRQELADIKYLYMSGSISRDEAKHRASSIIKRINDRAKEIAHKNNMTHYPIITFTSAMRNSYPDVRRSRFVVDGDDLIITPPDKQ